MKPINAMTIDVEDYFHVSAMETAVARADWPRLPVRVVDNTCRLLDLLEEAGVRGTWFVLGWVAERHPDLVRRIAARGHELGSHGYSHRLVYTQSAADFRRETLRSKALIEDQAQAPVRGYRAASYSIVRESLWALDVLVECGFEYDSSIFPVHHDRYGIPGFSRWPHLMDTPAGAQIVEFPLTTWRLGGLNVPIAGGGYFRLYPYALTCAGLRSVNEREGRPFIFYLHPWEIDPEQPRVSGLSWRSRFRHYNNLACTERRLARLLREFEFAPAADVLEAEGLLAAGGGQESWKQTG